MNKWDKLAIWSLTIVLLTIVPMFILGISEIPLEGFLDVIRVIPFAFATVYLFFLYPTIIMVEKK